MRWTWRQKDRNTTKVWQMRSDMPDLPCITGIHARPVRLRLNVCVSPPLLIFSSSLCVQEASQPLNLTSKQKGLELGKTPSPQSLELGSLALQGAFRHRDLQREASHSPPRSALSEFVTLLSYKPGSEDKREINRRFSDSSMTPEWFQKLALGEETWRCRKGNLHDLTETRNPKPQLRSYSATQTHHSNDQS